MVQLHEISHVMALTDNAKNSNETSLLSEAIIANFGRREWKLSISARKKLNKLCSEIISKKYRLITVMGFADSSGPKKYNFWISQKRAESAKEYLIEKGLEKDKISVFNFGDIISFVFNETEEKRSKNRRIEVRVWE